MVRPADGNAKNDRRVVVRQPVEPDNDSPDTRYQKQPVTFFHSITHCTMECSR